jgi:putative zinc finger/helix-turn-helix YgiT family protein
LIPEQISILEPAVILADAMELGYSFDKEFSSIFQELLRLATPENYAGARPPQQSYEAAIKGAELYSFVVQPTLLESVDVYFKFALYNDCLMLVSLHRDRKGETMENLQNNCPLGHGEMRNGTTTKEIDFRGERISYQLECLICPVCNLTRATVEQTAKAQNAIADAYRKKVGLLTGEEIRHRRVELGLSQQQLADKSRLSKMSIVRWENGVIQKESSDATLREILCPREIENEYSGNRELSLRKD